MTVSLALRNDTRISEPTRVRIQKLAQEMGYKCDPLLSAYGQQIRRRRTNAFHSSVAWLHDWWKRDDYKRLPWLSRYWQGANERAQGLGCALNPIWLREPGMSGPRVVEIMAARGIRGVMMHQTLNPEVLENFPFAEFASVSVGRNVLSDKIPLVLPDANSNALIALRHVVARGYKRIGFFQNRYHTERTLAEGLSSTFYNSYRMTGTPPLEPFFYTGHHPTTEHFNDFRVWLDATRPDVIFTENDDIIKFADSLKLRVPEDVAIVHLELTDAKPDWAGVDPLPEVLGSAAMDIIVGQLFRNEFGAQHPHESLRLIGQWRDGKTCRPPLDGKPIPDGKPVDWIRGSGKESGNFQ